jgi:hypothetical protein
MRFGFRFGIINLRVQYLWLRLKVIGLPIYDLGARAEDIEIKDEGSGLRV